MMHVTARATFPDSWRGLSAVHGLRARHSQRSRVLFLALAVLLGSTSAVHAATATWSANPETDIAGYILSYGTQTGVYTTTVNVGKVLTYQVTTLTPGQIYYFVLQAYDTEGLTSSDSAEDVFTDPVTSPPSLTSLTPTTGAVGTAVTIAGANFGATQGTSTITFNGTAATPTSWSAASIVVPVPSGATTGNVIVTVGGLASNGIGFTVTASAPTLASLTPASGAVGSTVTIAGANFGATQGSSTVQFNGNSAIGTPTSWSAVSIILPVPGTAITGSVIVTVGGLSSNGLHFTVTAPAPTMTSLTPTWGAVGTVVTIAGANFGATQGTSTVTFNGTVAVPTNWSAASIIVPTPSGATTGPVVVTVGGAASNAISFTVGPSTGAIALIQDGNVDGGTTLSASLAFSANNKAGNFIAVAIRAGSPSQVFTVKDSRGNGYQKAIQINGTVDTLAIYYAQSIVGGANTVIVSGGTLSTLRFAILEYAGIAASSPLDVTVAGQGSGTTPSSGSATTSSGDLVLGAIATAGSPGFSAGTGYTIEENVPAAPGTTLIAEDGLQAVAGSASVTATLLSSDTWVAAMAAFRAVTVATLTSPANGATNVNMTVPIQWTTVLNAQAYVLYLGSTLGTNDFVNTNQIQQTSYLATGVPGGQLVFARIWTEVGGVWLSSDSSFTTAAVLPVVATLTSPVNGAIKVNMTLPIQWTTVAGAQAYELYLGSTLGAKDIVDTGQIQQTSYLATGIHGNQLLFARIWTEAGGIWRSSDSSFTTAPVATLTVPVNGATSVKMTLPIQWTIVAGAQAYELYLGSTLGAKDLVDTGQIQQTSYLATRIPGSQTVFARIWAEVGGIWLSSDSSFTTAPIATLTFPVNGATSVNMNQPIQWTTVAGAQAYELYLGSTLGAKDFLDTGQLQQTSYLAIGVPGSQAVFARIWTEAGGVWLSSDSSFTTGAVAILTFPVNGATNVNMTLPIQWTSIAGAQAYELYLGSTLGAKDLVDTGQLQQTSYLATGLPAGQAVFARLWTEVGGVWLSSDSSFTTAAP